MPLNVLVVDDDPTVCWVTCRMLEPAGHTRAAAYSGATAVTFPGLDRVFDLFVIDVRLPDVSGLAVARSLSTRSLGTPVLFISGYPEALGEQFPDCRWDFLPKPFTHEQLYAAVRNLVPDATPA